MSRAKAGATNAELHQVLAKGINRKSRGERSRKEKESKSQSHSTTQAMKEIDDFLLNDS